MHYMLTAIITFSVALFGIAVLFLFKLYRLRTTDAATLGQPRTRADYMALSLKARIMRFSAFMETLPSTMWLIIRYFIHRGAKSFAKLARTSEIAAHRLADRVSHRHRFERGTKTSNYLRKVGEASSRGDGTSPRTEVR